MFKIISKNFKFENKRIIASLDFMIEGKIFLFDEEWSLTDSLPRLLNTIDSSHQLDNRVPPSNPLLVCSCGVINCDWADYEIELKDKFVVLSNFKKSAKVFFEGESFIVDKDKYTQEILQLAKDFYNFKETLNLIEEIDNEEVIENLKEKIIGLKDVESDSFKSENLPDIKTALGELKVLSVVKLAQEFNWKIEDIISCLYEPEEFIRYKAAEILGEFEDELVVIHLIEKLGDESDAVRYIAAKSLAKLGYLKMLDFMDELYLKRVWRGNCRKASHRFGKISRALHPELPLLTLIKNPEERVAKKAFTVVKTGSFFKNFDLISLFLDIASDYHLNKNIRIEAIISGVNINKQKMLPVMTEIIQDPRESEEIKEDILNILKTMSSPQIIPILKDLTLSIHSSEKIKNKIAEMVISLEKKSQNSYLNIIIYLLAGGTIIFFILSLIGIADFIKFLICGAILTIVLWLIFKG